MDSQETLRNVDSILLPLLRIDNPEFRPALDEILTVHAEPVIVEIIRYRLRVSMNSNSPGREIDKDAEDIHNEVVLRLLSRLRDFRISPEEKAIHDFRKYVAVVSHNACNEYFRAKYPERSRLKNRIRYLLRHHSDFAIWESGDNEMLCGLSGWRDKKTPARTEKYHQLQANPTNWEGASRAKGISVEFINDVFFYLENPLLLDDLVSIAATILGIKEKFTHMDEALPDNSADLPPVTEMGRKGYLMQLWVEICQIPLRQRTALLLNLRDEKGTNVIQLFTYTGVAGIRQMADALEIPVRDFAVLWPELPIEDTRIAVLLGVTRQQVINLRKCARERLARRMRRFQEAVENDAAAE